MNSSDKIYFIHVPKTAGSSLRQMLIEEYGERLLLLYDSQEIIAYDERDPAFIASFGKRLAASTVLYGHYRFGAHEAFDMPGAYMAILRHPVERIRSYYHHHARKEHMKHYNAINHQGMTLSDFIRKDNQAKNYISRMLTGIKRYDDAQLFEQARKNIDKHFLYVGLTEQLDKSINAISEHLGWQTKHSLPYVNVNDQTLISNIDPSTMVVFEEYNDKDLLLYDYVKNKFF